MKDDVSLFLWVQILIVLGALAWWQSKVNQPTVKASAASLAATNVRPTYTPKPTIIPTLTQIPRPTQIPKPLPTQESKPTQTVSVKSSNSLTEAINEYRQSRGKTKLRSGEDLCKAAKQRAEKVGSNLSHDGYQEVLNSIPHSASGENLWWGTKVSATAIVEAWSGSEGHNRNILGDWTKGCGEIAGNTAVFLFIR